MSLPKELEAVLTVWKMCKEQVSALPDYETDRVDAAFKELIEECNRPVGISHPDDPLETIYVERTW